jgi:hypothetical protein
MKSRLPIIEIRLKDQFIYSMCNPCTTLIPWLASASIPPSIRVARRGRSKIGSNCIQAWTTKIEEIASQLDCTNLILGNLVINPLKSPSSENYPLWVVNYHKLQNITRREGLQPEFQAKVSILFNLSYHLRGGLMPIRKKTINLT